MAKPAVVTVKLFGSVCTGCVVQAMDLHVPLFDSPRVREFAGWSERVGLGLFTTAVAQRFLLRAAPLL